MPNTDCQRTQQMSEFVDNKQQISTVKLLEKLKINFDVVCFEDLSELSTTHGSAFNLFEKYYQDVFQPSQKLIFYSSFSPDQDLCDHIQQAASQCDISNYFILICTPYDLEEKLNIANRKYGYDNVSIQHTTVQLQSTKELIKRFSNFSDTICPLPFSAMFVRNNGDSGPCCRYSKILGTINENTTASDVFNNSQFNNLRQQMLEGKKPQDCSRCWKQEEKGSPSLRQYMLKKYQKMLNSQWIDDIKIRAMDITPSFLCNFKCRVCSRELSSSIASEDLKFAKTEQEANIIKKEINLTKKDFDFDMLCHSIEQADGLEYITILGGEPLLWKDLEKFLDFMIATEKANSCRLEFNTNGSSYPENIIKKISKFKFCQVLFSVDNVGDRSETERGGDWQTVKCNLEKFANLDRNKFEVSLAPTVNIQNLLYLDELETLAESLQLHIVWSYLDKPKILAIDNITKKMKDAVLEKYSKTKSNHLKTIHDRIKNTKPIESREFIDYMDKLDSRRSKKFKETHSLIYNLMTPDIDLTRET